MADSVDDFLQHFGVKGMHWGVRRSRGGYTGKASAAKARLARTKQDPSSDHTEVKTLRKKSLPALSNSELEKLNKRLQLEKTYKELTQSKSRIDKGQKAANRILNIANTAQSAYNLYNSPMAKSVRKLLNSK